MLARSFCHGITETGRTVAAAFSLQNTCVYVSSELPDFNCRSPVYVIWLSATCHPWLPPVDSTCSSQLSVESPESWLKEKDALSPRLPLVALTDPELFGQPVPENLRAVMRGEEGGAAAMSAGREKRMIDARIVGVDFQDLGRVGMTLKI